MWHISEERILGCWWRTFEYCGVCAGRSVAWFIILEAYGTSGYPRANMDNGSAIWIGYFGSIEALQYLSNRGFSEVDDVTHNTLGCVRIWGLSIDLQYIIKI